MQLLKHLIFTLLLTLLSSNSLAGNGSVSAKMGTWHFGTQNVSAEDEQISGVGAYAFEVSYSFFSHVSFVFGFNLIMSELISGSSGYGFDLGARYFPLSETGNRRLTSGETDIQIQQIWRPYLGLSMRQRIFGLAISTSYFGPGLSLGLEYSMSQNWFLTTEFRYDQLYGQENAVLTQTNFLLGVGIEF